MANDHAPYIIARVWLGDFLIYYITSLFGRYLYCEHTQHDCYAFRRPFSLQEQGK